MPSDPNEQGREDRGAEDDPERGLCQIAARRLLGKLARDEFKMKSVRAWSTCRNVNWR